MDANAPITSKQSTNPAHADSLLKHLQDRFTVEILPCVTRWARRQFGRNDEAIAEAIGLAWKWVRRAHESGKDVFQFRSALARFAVRAVRSGRRVVGKIKAKDAMNPITQAKKGFYVGHLPDFSTESANPLTEALADHSLADVGDHVAFKIDFPTFRETLGEREQAIMDDMMVGERTKDIAQKHGVSEGRISQLRREFAEGWREFHGEGA